MKKVHSLRNAVMVSLLAGTTVVWGGTVFAAEDLQEFALEEMCIRDRGYAYAVMNDPAYRDVKAVRNKQIKFVSDKYRYVASQHIVDAIENIAHAVYPEIF